MDALNSLKLKYLSAISDAIDEATLEDLRVVAVGKKGEISIDKSQSPYKYHTAEG